MEFRACCKFYKEIPYQSLKQRNQWVHLKEHFRGYQEQAQSLTISRALLDFQELAVQHADFPVDVPVVLEFVVQVGP